ncbi:hypothetical protein [Synoicihabitans lomoniglobus]|uniref:Uncharacterized protein n=1 Tax=Synoicihabitans lomoniglobus TaxID=2909285 RepID=A0AAE9ZV66_9BACT|nr:hypothetical protein [Opitutaceae bacterium LMO-M01]WED65655.1 hypothetical protein PXH66_02190 [Opitutaceae bacterium LMO-M01]
MSAEPSLANRNLSQVPSWVLAGFLVGVVTMWLFQSKPAEPTPVPGAAVAAEPAAETEAPTSSALRDAEKPSIEIVEALFEQFRDWVFWSDDRTQIAVWNSTTLSFSDYFEVVRTEEADYFRSIPGFTRLPLDGYGPVNSPILFTETAEQRAKRFYQANPDKVKVPDAPAPIEFKTLPRAPGGE